MCTALCQLSRKQDIQLTARLHNHQDMGYNLQPQMTSFKLLPYYYYYTVHGF